MRVSQRQGQRRAGLNQISQSGETFTAELSYAANPGSDTSATAPLDTTTYAGTLQATTAGDATFALLYGGSFLPGFPVSFAVLPGTVAAATSVLRTLPAVVAAGDAIELVLEARDAFSNLVRSLL